MHRLAIAVTSLLGVTAAAYVAGYLLVFGAAADRAASLVPADAAVYARAYLQPSAGQQANLAELIGRLPGFADEATLDEKVDQVVQNLLAGSGVDYRSEIKPWLGNQLAAASWFTDEDPAIQRAVLIVEVKDRATAEAALAGLAEASGTAPTEETHAGTVLHVGDPSWAFVEEMLVISDAPDAVRMVIDTAAGAPDLAGRADFRAQMAQLPQDHLAAAFVDMTAVGAEVPDAQLQGFSTAAAALVAERDALRISGGAPRDAAGPDASAPPGLGGEPSTLTEWMPADTVTAAVIFGLDDLLTDAEAAASGTPGGEELSDALAGLRAMAALGFGIDLDADLLPLLDREVAIAITGAEDGAPRGLLLLRPSDPETGIATLDQIADRLAEMGGERGEETVDGVDVTIVTVPQFGEVAYAGDDGVLILGLAVDDVRAAIGAHADGTHLAASASYRSAFDVAGERAGNEVYADVGALVEFLGIAQTLPADARDILAQIGTFALAMPSRDDQWEIHAVLTIDEAGAE